MKKKFYSILALPLLAIMCLFGCGTTDRTVKEITTLWTDTVAAYETPAATGRTNWYFGKDNTDNQFDVFTVIYDGDLQSQVASATTPTTTLEKRYAQLRTVYGRTLTMAYNYYSNWNATFFAGIEAKNPEADDLTELYDRMKAFQRELATFNTAKQNLEREVRLFGLDSEIIGSSVDTFNYNYQNLIDKTLGFVNCFRDLHVKYFYADKTIDSSYAKRLFDEGVLDLANYIYYDYLNALSKNSTVKSVVLNEVNQDENVFNIFAYSGSKLNEICNDSRDRTYQLSADFTATLLDPTANEALYATNSAIVKKFEVALNKFKQHFTLYQKVYSRINMEGYNNYRFGINGAISEEEYFAGLSVVDAANARVIKNFEESNIYAFMNAIVKYHTDAKNA